MSENKTCLIKQPAGLGDILFAQKIASHFRELDYNILWPVIPQYNWISEYIDNIDFVDQGSEFPYKDIYNSNIIDLAITEDRSLFYVPLHTADRKYPDSKIIMSKFDLAGLSIDDWQDYFIFNRNHEKENELFYNVLSLNDNTKYNFVNKMYGPPPNVNIFSNLTPNPELQTVELEIIDGFTLFDWCKVIENATEIHVVNTSIVCIMEKLALSAQIKNLYLAEGRKTYEEIEYVFNKIDWNYML